MGFYPNSRQISINYMCSAIFRMGSSVEVCGVREMEDSTQISCHLVLIDRSGRGMCRPAPQLPDVTAIYPATTLINLRFSIKWVYYRLIVAKMSDQCKRRIS